MVNLASTSFLTRTHGRTHVRTHTGKLTYRGGTDPPKKVLIQKFWDKEVFAQTFCGRKFWLTHISVLYPKLTDWFSYCIDHHKAASTSFLYSSLAVIL